MVAHLKLSRLIEQKNKENNFFANRKTVVLNKNIGYFHELKIVNGFLYGITRTVPAKLVKINPDSLTVASELTFPLDGYHNYASDFIFEKKQNKFYIVFGGVVTLVSQVDLKTFSYKDVFLLKTNYQSSKGNINSPSITDDGEYFYIISNFKQTVVHKIQFKDLKLINTTLLANQLSYGHTIRFYKNYLYATGGRTGWIAKIRPDDLSYTYKVFPKKYRVVTDDMAMNKNTIFIGFENEKGELLAVDTDDLSYFSIPTNIKADCYGVYYDGKYIWALFKTSPGKIIQINMRDKVLKEFNMGAEENNPNEIITDGKRLFISYWTELVVISRIDYD